MKRLLLILCGVPLWAHDPITTKLTWTREVSRLIERRCIACHGDGSAVPLTSYEKARPWAKAMRDQVMTRRMPPWGAVPGFGPAVRGDRSLTAAEIETMVRWVEGGAPEGDAIWLAHTHPKADGALPVLHGPLFQARCDWHVPENVQLVGIRPLGIGHDDEMRITLSRADGSAEPVLWIREFPETSHDFVLARPLSLQKGEVLRVEAAGSTARAALALSPATRLLRQPETEIRKQIQNCPAR